MYSASPVRGSKKKNQKQFDITIDTIETNQNYMKHSRQLNS